MCASGDESHRKVLDAVEEVAAQADGLAAAFDPCVTAEHFIEEDSDLEAGQDGAEAEVWSAAAEGDVLVALAAYVEGVRMGEDHLVAVGRDVPQADHVTGLDGRSGDCHLFERVAPEVEDG